MSYGIGLLFWWLGGALSFWLLDRKEMRKPVQYETMPSGVPLSTIRIVSFAVMLVFGPIYAILCGLLAVERWRTRRLIGRRLRECNAAIKRINEILARHGVQ